MKPTKPKKTRLIDLLAKRPRKSIEDDRAAESGDDDAETPATQWTDRERVLMVCSRGALARTRHLVNDWRRLMPHCHAEAKFDKSTSLAELNEIAELANCTKCLYFESRKRQDVYMWLSSVVDDGPSVKLLVHNVHTMAELNLTGNCLKGSRPVLSFDPAFDTKAHLRLIKELLKQTFKTPQYHPRSQPFIDHVLNFALTDDGNIWLRNYQLVDAGAKMEEIGPRMVLEVIRVFAKSFHGEVLYDNPSYITPNSRRREVKIMRASELQHRKDQKVHQQVKQQVIRATRLEDPIDPLFNTIEHHAPTDGDDTGRPGLSAAAKRLDRAITKKGKARKRAIASTDAGGSEGTGGKSARMMRGEVEDDAEEQ